MFLRQLVVGDVSVIHPATAFFAWDASKRRAYRQVSSALPFVPNLVESYGCLGGLALSLLGDLADQAVQAGGPGPSRAALYR
jgi:hypothetical protein